MLIILEGNEAVYKTTIAKKLSEKYKLPIEKGSSFEQSTVSNPELFTGFFQMALAENVIYDRFIYSNLVYANLYEDFSILSQQQIASIEQEIKEKSHIFYLYASSQQVKDRLLVRGDDYVESNMVEKINQKFKSVIEKSKLNINKIDTTNKTSDDAFNEIISVIENE